MYPLSGYIFEIFLFGLAGVIFADAFKRIMREGTGQGEYTILQRLFSNLVIWIVAFAIAYRARSPKGAEK